MAAAWCAAVLLLGAGSVVALHDEAEGVSTLAALEPVVDGLGRVGNRWLGHSLILTPLAAGSVAALLVVLAWRRRRTIGPATALAATALAVAGEAGLLLGASPGAAALLVVGAVGLTVAARPAHAAPLSGGETVTRWGEVGLLIGVLAVATVLRLFALDRVVGWFDGELAGYYAAATRLAGIPLANEGVDGSWAPLGLTAYPPYVVAVHLAGTTVLALRLAAAWVGVLSIPLLYMFVRRLAGTPAALTAAALLALDPLSVGWSRSDAHPHGFTLWPVLLVCLATLAALRDGGRRAWFITALTMGLAWHQYPSGQVAVLIPPLALVLVASEGDEGRRRIRGALPGLLLGGLLWFAGLPLSGWLATGRLELRNPFTLTGSRAAWSPDVAPTAAGDRLALVGRTVAANAADLAVGIVREARVVSHQDFLPDSWPLPSRLLPWTVAIGGLLGTALLLRRRAEPGAAVLLAWLAVAPLPALFAAGAYPKRAATLFPAFGCAAAVFAAWLFTSAWPDPTKRVRRAAWVLAGTAFAMQTILMSCFWFSGRQWPAGRPSEIAIARHIADELVPGTLIVVDGAFTYIDSKLLYLLLDDLAAREHRPNAFVIFEGETADFSGIVERPTAALRLLDEIAWPYRWTRLAGQRDEVAAARDWPRVIWVIGERTLPEQRPNLLNVPLVRAACPPVWEHTFHGAGTPAEPQTVTVLVCDRFTAGRSADQGGVEPAVPSPVATSSAR
jgi:hypothetical protein